MKRFSDGYKALVIGSSGSIGAAFVRDLQVDEHCEKVTSLSRSEVNEYQLTIDLKDEVSAQFAAHTLQLDGPFDLILVATGVLHGDDFMPEKRLADLDIKAMQETFSVNTLGPALLLKYFLPLLSNAGVMGLISAKVGSIGDNRLGGWYTYRASKAALNMLIKTASIELKRQKPEAMVVAIHPGTVISELSKPFAGGSGSKARDANIASQEILQVLDKLKPEQSGGFFAYDGQELPW
ncbi:MAG: hypothetical protein RL061_1449 [Pseudomonadota bacterium]